MKDENDGMKVSNAHLFHRASISSSLSFFLSFRNPCRTSAEGFVAKVSFQGGSADAASLVAAAVPKNAARDEANDAVLITCEARNSMILFFFNKVEYLWNFSFNLIKVFHS